MSDEGDDDRHPARDAIEGLGLLFRAGKHAAKKLKKEIDRSNVGRSLDDAGKEVVRAVDNVVSRITGEPLKRPEAPRARRDDDPPPPAPDKPTGPTPEDPGYRIAQKDEDDAGKGPK